MTVEHFRSRKPRRPTDAPDTIADAIDAVLQIAGEPLQVRDIARGVSAAMGRTVRPATVSTIIGRHIGRRRWRRFEISGQVVSYAMMRAK